jgi:polyhydroxyalkanoate synthesis regulator phasin
MSGSMALASLRADTLDRMNRTDVFRRYLEAGMEFTQLTQRRAEALVRDLVKSGEVQAEQAQAMVAELVERSRKNSDRLLEQVRAEIRKQFKALGVATKDDIARLERRINDVKAAGTSTRKATARKTTAKKTTAKKTTAKKAGSTPNTSGSA